jgi:hypothetical protein
MRLRTRPNHALQRTAAGPSRLPSARLVAAVAEFGSLGGKCIVTRSELTSVSKKSYQAIL